MRTIRLAAVATLVAGLGFAQGVGATPFVDDFSLGNADLANYSAVVILDANGGASNTKSWDLSTGIAQYATTAFDGIEQSALVRNTALAVGEELQVDLANRNGGGSQDLGLYVGVQPTVNVRANYLNVYARNNGQIFSRGFDGTTEVGLTGGATPTFTSLFIARTGATSYDLGYYNGAVRTIVTSRTVAATNDASYVGLYTDVRALGTVGDADNLRIVPIPEPASLTAFGAAGLLMARRRRRG